MTQAAQLAQYGASSVGLAFKNRIINGAMMIDQRNAGASVSLSTTTQYPVDRFPSYKGTAGATITAQQRSTANIAHPAGFNNSILYTVSTGSSPAAGDINAFWQTIEGFNVADLGWGTANAKTVTLSFWVRSSITGTYGVSFNNAANNRIYLATYTVNSANTWEQKSVTIAGDTSGTWATDNTVGLQVTWDLGYGSNFNGTAGSWGSSVIRRTSGSVTLAANTGATFYITGVQLEVGSTATSFDYRPYTTELQLCQRYYETGQIVRYGGPTNINQGNEFSQTFLVSKRAAPTITYASTSFQNQVNAIGSSNITTSGFVATFGCSATGYGFGQGTMTASIEL